MPFCSTCGEPASRCGCARAVRPEPRVLHCVHGNCSYQTADGTTVAGLVEMVAHLQPDGTGQWAMHVSVQLLPPDTNSFSNDATHTHDFAAGSLRWWRRSDAVAELVASSPPTLMHLLPRDIQRMITHFLNGGLFDPESRPRTPPSLAACNMMSSLSSPGRLSAADAELEVSLLIERNSAGMLGSGTIKMDMVRGRWGTRPTFVDRMPAVTPVGGSPSAGLGSIELAVSHFQKHSPSDPSTDHTLLERRIVRMRGLPAGSVMADNTLRGWTLASVAARDLQHDAVAVDCALPSCDIVAPEWSRDPAQLAFQQQKSLHLLQLWAARAACESTEHLSAPTLSSPVRPTPSDGRPVRRHKIGMDL